MTEQKLNNRHFQAAEIRAEARAALADNRAYWWFLSGLILLGCIVSVAVILGLVGIVGSALTFCGSESLPPHFMATMQGADNAAKAAALMQVPQVFWLCGLSGALVASALFVYLGGYVQWGKAAMAIAAQRRGLVLGHAFSGWGNGWRMGWLQLVKFTYVQLWALLFIIPGILAALAYALADYLAVDHPDWSASQCLRESRRLMQGHRWELVVLYFSFWPWYAAVYLSAAFIPVVGQFLAQFLAPYVQTANATFYEFLLDGDEASNSADQSDNSSKFEDKSNFEDQQI